MVASGVVSPYASMGFENGDLTGPSGPITFSASAGGSVQTTQARTGTYSARVRFAAVADCVDPVEYLQFDFTQITRKVWCEFYWFPPSNYSHRDQSGCPNTNTHWKFFTIYGVGYGGSGRPKIVLEGWRTSDTVTTLRVVHNMAGQAGSQPLTGNPLEDFIGGGGPITLNAWNRVRIFGDCGTSGDDNAEIKVWINSTLTHSESGIGNSSGPGLSTFYWDGGWIMNVHDGGYDDQTDFYIDDYKLYSADPGW